MPFFTPKLLTLCDQTPKLNNVFNNLFRNYMKNQLLIITLCLINAFLTSFLHPNPNGSHKLRRTRSSATMIKSQANKLRKSLKRRFSSRELSQPNKQPAVTGTGHLHLAADDDECGTIYQLLKKGVKINDTNSDQQTALHRAASHGCIDALNTLAMNHADLNKQDKDGNTPLHIALNKYFQSRYPIDQIPYKEIIVALVVKYQASRSIKNNQGQSFNQQLGFTKNDPKLHGDQSIDNITKALERFAKKGNNNA